MASSEAEFHTHGWYEALLARCVGLPPIPTAVAHPCDAVALDSAVKAAALGLIVPILVGPEAKIRAAAQAAGADISNFRLEPAPHSHAAAASLLASPLEGVSSRVGRRTYDRYGWSSARAVRLSGRSAWL